MITLADTLLAIHVLIAAFLTLGFVVVPLGAWWGWAFVRRRSLRLLHLGGIVFVALQAVLGVACPLTVWEDALRGHGASDIGFIARGMRWLLYYDVPLWVFGLMYIAAAGLALLLWHWVPPA